jgi:eukaryotic-like serine/threonine-protein kinase
VLPEAVPAVEPRELVLDRYRPLRPLGSGGSGSVWLARDEQTGLDVALKVVPRDGKAGHRAEREALVASRLRHDRCLRAYGCGSDSRHVYVAYEYAPGRTLRDALRAGELGDADAVEAATQVLDGLAHAHARGVVHRDVKPANVLLADGDGVSVRLLDFGLAQTEDAETLTAVGDVPGTLAYIPPERLSGDFSGPAADVWAVGVLLWEALAGMHPFWTSSPVETARAIERGAPPLAEARPDLPRALLAAVDEALAHDPARRPSAARLAASLREALEERARRRPRARYRLVRPRAESYASPALAALVAGWSAAALPFFPSGWWVGLGLLAALLAAARPRIGLAFALAVPILPLGNVSLALALLWTLAAAVWLGLAAGEPRSGLLFAAGPLLAPIGALGFLPLLAATAVRSPARRFAQAAGAVVAAAAVAGARGTALPFAGAHAHVDLAGRESVAGVADALARVVGTHAGLGLAALALGVAAALVPTLARRGPWGIAGIGALLLLPTVVAPAVGAAPVVATAWLSCAALALNRNN